MALTQNLSMCTRVHPMRVKQERPKAPAERARAPITVLAAPSSVDEAVAGAPAFLTIPYAPKRRQVAHFGSRSCFVSEAAIVARQEQRIQRRTDALMHSLTPYIGADGQVVRGAWKKIQTEE